MRNLRIIALLLIVLSVAVACKKKKENPNVAGTWRVASVTKDDVDDPTNVGATFTLNSNGTYSVTASPITTMETSGTWALSSTKKSITFSNSSDPAIYTIAPIIVLKAKNMELDFTEPSTFKSAEIKYRYKLVR